MILATSETPRATPTVQGSVTYSLTLVALESCMFSGWAKSLVADENPIIECGFLFGFRFKRNADDFGWFVFAIVDSLDIGDTLVV